MSARPEGWACSACAEWRARPHGQRGDCLKSGHFSSSYRLVGAMDGSEVFEETKPDYWCTLFEPKPSEPQ